jgi:Domain of unknown function (DUF5056)
MQELIDEEQLDRQLREAVSYIHDDGFTMGVLQRLPARPGPGRMRAFILIAATIVATVLAYVLSGGGRFVHDIVAELSALPTRSLLTLSFGAGILVSVFGLAAAVFNDRETSSLAR